jgi:tellurite methyltransferase
VNARPQETRNAPLLDVRPESDFLSAHEPGAASIPLEELPARIHELPPANVSLRVIDSDPNRSGAAAEFLSRRGHVIEIVPWQPLLRGELGRSGTRLWRPNPFLVESMEAIRTAAVHLQEKKRRAMDVACGSGRDAVFLALQGYDVLAIDLLPDALDRAADLARRNNVAVMTHAMDVEAGPALPPGSFDLVTVFRFLYRPLFPLLRNAVAPGGFLVYETFHERNSDTGLGPKNPAHLLKTGELASAFAGIEVLICRDAFEREGRFFSSLLARRLL